MRQLLMYLVVVAVAGSASAQSLAPLQSDADLHDVHFVNTQEGWAVGDRGVILHTADGGGSWLPQTTPISTSLYGVHFVDAKHGWAVGGATLPYMKRGRGVVLRTDDGGKTWLREPVDTLPALRRVWFQSEKSGFAVGDGSPLFPSGVFFTGDGGRSWNPVAVRGLAGWSSADFRSDSKQQVAGIGLLLSSQGQIVRCVGGNCTTAQTPLPRHRMRDIAWLSDRQAFVVGDHGTAWMTIDGGLQWQDISRLLLKASAEPHDLITVACQGDSVCIGNNVGKMVRSNNGGRTWTEQAAGVSSVPANRIQLVDAQHAFAVGGLGTIRTTTDGGATWAVQRGANRRMFALGIFSKTERVPWMLWADLAGGNNARVRLSLIHI